MLPSSEPVFHNSMVTFPLGTYLASSSVTSVCFGFTVVDSRPGNDTTTSLQPLLTRASTLRCCSFLLFLVAERSLQCQIGGATMRLAWRDVLLSSEVSRAPGQTHHMIRGLNMGGEFSHSNLTNARGYLRITSCMDVIGLLPASLTRMSSFI